MKVFCKNICAYPGIFNIFIRKLQMALWILIDGDMIRMIAHLVHLGLEKALFLDEFNAVAHQVGQTGIKHRVSVSVIPIATGILSS